MQTGAALSRLNDFAMERNLILIARDSLEELPPLLVDEYGGKDNKCQLLCRKMLSSKEVKEQFKDRYAQIFQGWYQDQIKSTRYHAGLLTTTGKAKPNEAPHFQLIYCPLLPHHSQPHFDPTVSSEIADGS